MIAQAHLELVKLARLGVSQVKIARVTGIPLAAVAVILRSPLAQAEVVRGA